MAQQRCVNCKKFLKNGSKTCPLCGAVQPDSEITKFAKIQDKREADKKGENSEKKEDKKKNNTDSRIGLFFARIPLLASFLLLLVILFIGASLLFVVIGCIYSPSTIAIGGLSSLYIDLFPLLIILSLVFAALFMPSILQKKAALGFETDAAEFAEYLGKVICVAILLGILVLFHSCFFDSGNHSSSDNFSERAQELGTTTREYTDAYNYWRYGNP